MFAGFGAGAEALRRLEQGGAAPDVARLSDEDETRLGLGMAGLRGRARRARCRPTCARAAWPAARWPSSAGQGPDEAVRVRREAAIEALRDAGGVALGSRRGARGCARASTGPTCATS